jgi:hypothetical protein
LGQLCILCLHYAREDDLEKVAFDSARLPDRLKAFTAYHSLVPLLHSSAWVAEVVVVELICNNHLITGYRQGRIAYSAVLLSFNELYSNISVEPDPQAILFWVSRAR